MFKASERVIVKDNLKPLDHDLMSFVMYSYHAISPSYLYFAWLYKSPLINSPPEFSWSTKFKSFIPLCFELIVMEIAKVRPKQPSKNWWFVRTVTFHPVASYVTFQDTSKKGGRKQDDTIKNCLCGSKQCWHPILSTYMYIYNIYMTMGRFNRLPHLWKVLPIFEQLGRSCSRFWILLLQSRTYHVETGNSDFPSGTTIFLLAMLIQTIALINLSQFHPFTRE